MSAHSKSKKTGMTKQKFFKITMFTAIIMAGVVLGAVIYAASTLPAWNPDQLSGSSTTILYDDKDESIGGLHAGENRTEIGLDQVPRNLTNAFLAT